MLCAGIAQADHPSAGLGSDLAGPVETISPDTLPQGLWAGGLRTEYISFDEITDRKLTKFSEQGKKVHSTGSLTSLAVSIAYGMTNNLTLAARLPHVYRCVLCEVRVRL